MVADLNQLLGSGTGPIVVKIGSALLVDAEGKIREHWLQTVVEDIAALLKTGHQVVVVSSGSIALGARRLKLAQGGRASLEDAQASAAVGQIALSRSWAGLLGTCGMTAAQLLVTLGDLEDRRRYLNCSATLGRLVELGVVPIVNENDSVATQHIRFGDNDRLAARVGQAASARAVVLLSDIDGLYTANPHKDPDATLIPRVGTIDETITGMADGGSASGMGSGGMNSKIEAAKIATAAGIPLVIATGKVDHPLQRFFDSGHGTIFSAEGDTLSARKGWLAGRLTTHGRIVVDAGAERAIIAGSSLLPAGVITVEGPFTRGDVVDIVNQDGTLIARGFAEYDARDAWAIMGKRSVEHAEILGYAPRSVLVHRSHMVRL